MYKVLYATSDQDISVDVEMGKRVGADSMNEHFFDASCDGSTLGIPPEEERPLGGGIQADIRPNNGFSGDKSRS